MNKSEFVNYISEKHSCTKIEAEKVIGMFVSSVIDALGAGNEISMVGFGSFSINKVAARKGRNPITGAELDIRAYNKVTFRVGKKLKDVVNRK